MTNQLEREVTELHNTVCSALADPTRILIIYTLAEGRQNVTDLAKSLGLSQPTASRHLKNLRERGLVDTKREGTSVYYSLVDPKLVRALDLLRDVMLGIFTRRAAALVLLNHPPAE